MARRRKLPVLQLAILNTRRGKIDCKGLLTTASHIPVLLQVLRVLRPKNVLEVGAGWYSTPLLQAYALASGAEHCILETNKFYRDTVSRLCGCRIDLFDGYTLPDAVMCNWGLVFIDHAIAGTRKDVALAIKDHANTIVLHDSNPKSDAAYLYSKIIPQWKHYKQFTALYPHTLLLTDSDEVWQALGA